MSPLTCIEHHVPASRTAGLSDAQISEAIRLADQVRQVPARKTLDTALGLLAEPVPAALAEKALLWLIRGFLVRINTM